MPAVGSAAVVVAVGVAAAVVLSAVVLAVVAGVAVEIESGPVDFATGVDFLSANFAAVVAVAGGVDSLLEICVDRQLISRLARRMKRETTVRYWKRRKKRWMRRQGRRKRQWRRKKQ